MGVRFWALSYIYIYIYNFQADAIPKVYIEEGCKLFGIVSTYSPARYKT